MRLKSEFIKLPLCFDVDRLQNEVNAFEEDDWCPHPQGFAGNSALLLISAHGSIADDGMKGPMLPTPLLKKSPYLCQVLAAFGTVFGRTRLMRLDGNAEANRHMDASYYWHQRMRVHVPIQTHPEVDFLCGDKKVHMKAGESWLFDTWEKHNVINPVDKIRIHLVADTVGSARFQRLIDQSWYPFLKNTNSKQKQLVEFVPDKKTEVVTEMVNFPVVMTPWEQESLLAPILNDISQNKDTVSVKLIQLIESFKLRWKATWHANGDTIESESLYQNALSHFTEKFKELNCTVTLPNGMNAVNMVMQAVFEPALNPELRRVYQGHSSIQNVKTASNAQGRNRTPVLGQPIFIVAAPRSGSTLLFETLAQSPDLYTIGGESHHLIEGLKALTPMANNFESNRLTAKDVTLTVANHIRSAFMKALKDRKGKPVKANMPPIRMLEKTPKNSLRIPFLKAIFPQAKFIYLYRNPRENISSIIDAWGSGRFVTYKELPGRKLPWSLLLVSGWRKLDENDVPFTAATQWQQVHETMMSDFKNFNSDKVMSVRYENLLENPQSVIENICEFADISWDQKLDKNLPLSKHTLTKPKLDKWKKNEKELLRVLPYIQETRLDTERFINKIDLYD
jgi:hypothetical protein